MKHATALLFGFCVLLAACHSQPQEEVQPQAGLIRDGEYQYAPIGWRMPLPWRWNVLSAQQLQATLGKGRSLVEQAAGGEVIDTDTHLLYLRFDASNQFTSSVSDFDAAAGTEPEQVDATIELVLAAYEAGKFRVRHARESEIIGGIRFERMRISMLDPNGTREIGRQDIYLGRVGASSLTTSITSTHWIPRQQMLHAWRASRFSTPPDTD